MNNNNLIQYIIIGIVLLVLWVGCGLLTLMGVQDLLTAYPQSSALKVDGILGAYFLLTLFVIDYYRRPVFATNKPPRP